MLKHINNYDLSVEIGSSTVLGKLRPDCFKRIHSMSPPNDVVYISKIHAKIVVDVDQSSTILTNLGVNSTYVNRDDVIHTIEKGEFKLHNGDIISFGAPHMMVPNGALSNDEKVMNPYTFVYHLGENEDSEDMGDLEMGCLKKVIKNHLSCPICYNWLKKPCRLSCGHIFCNKCISRWRQGSTKCPMCRKEGHVSRERCFVIENLIKDVRCIR